MVLRGLCGWVCLSGDYQALNGRVKGVCYLHGIKLYPSRATRTVGCWMCTDTNKKSEKSKVRRRKRWNNTFICCVNHSDRRCSLGRYVFDGKRRCGSCTNRWSDGRKRPTMVRHINKTNFAKSMKRRFQLSGRLRGLALFERLTGMNLVALGFAG